MNDIAGKNKNGLKQAVTNHTDKPTRRSAIKSIAAGGLIGSGYLAIPDSWKKPIIKSVVAPAHATTSILPQTLVFGFTGSNQPFTIPTGVVEVEIVSLGASGGPGGVESGSPAAGGLGGQSTGTVGVTAGEMLTIVVGGQGQPGEDGMVGVSSGGSGGFGGGADGGSTPRTAGGGSGGGASWVEQGGVPIVVAGGGGGGGGGGNESSPGGAGGNGGGAGVNGGDATGLDPGLGGQAGGAGGAGGMAGGASGAALSGGAGADGTSGGAGGGGGGGATGGGGGGAGTMTSAFDGGAGGGGGSGSAGPGGSTTDGVNSGDGSITLTLL